MSLKNKGKVFVVTNGCARRGLDATRLINFFKANNCVLVNNVRIADYIIFVTCSFMKAKEEQCLTKIKEFLKYRGKLIILGCLPDISPINLKKIFNGEFIETRNLYKIDELFGEFKVKFSDISDAHRSERMLPLFSLKQRFIQNFALNKVFFMKCLHFLLRKCSSLTYVVKCIRRLKKTEKTCALFRVCYGCNQHCAYCTIFRAVGKLKSKTINDCVSEYGTLLKNGYRNFEFLADNLGSYGLDIGSTFEELLYSLSKVDITIPVKWRIRNLSPMWVIKYKDVLLKYIGEGKIVHILCEIQSGSNRILQLMNRHHRIEDIIEVLKEFRKLQPMITLTTDIIVGFPTETEDDFLATMYALKAINFNSVSVYPYSDGYGSIASEMSGKVPEKTIFERLKKAKVNM